MQLKTILNRVTNYKSFVVGKVQWVENGEELSLEVEMRPRANGRPICSGCGKARPGYDRAETPRRFEFVPLWMISVVFVYHMRRVKCPSCGTVVERVPWSEGKSPMTTEYKWFLARWARRMCWKDVSETFCVSWDRVYNAVKQAVSWVWSTATWTTSERLEWTKSSGTRAISIKRWFINWTKAKNDCSGSERTERPKRCSASFAFWARLARPGFSLFVAICGRRT